MIEVVCGVFVRDGRLLIVQRKPGGRHGGYWEFPGGKIEAGESAEHALVRELAEELGVTVRVGRLVGESTDGTIRLRGYLLREWRGDIVLVDHVALRWSLPAELERVALPQADLALLRRVLATDFVE
jgi:8-oxo-dGTP diphosphatase